MDCVEAHEHLSDLNRGLLKPGLAGTVRAHVSACARCAAALRLDAELRARIRTEVPRYAASPVLRGRIQALLADSASATPSPTPPSGWRAWLHGHRWPVGSLAGVVAALLLVWAGLPWILQDPVSLLSAHAIDEHAEYVKETMTRPAADPAAVVRELRGLVNYAFEPVFPGDAQIQMIAGKVSDLSGRRVATFIYRDTGGRYATLFLLAGVEIAIPSEGRKPIGAFTPYHRRASGRELLLWTQGPLTCVLVSDQDAAGAASLFLKVRQAT